LKLDQAAYSFALEEMNVFKNLPHIQAVEPRPKSSGLALHIGIWCKHCLKLYKGDASMVVHYTMKHKWFVKPKNFTMVHYQQLNNGIHTTKFEVMPQRKQTVSPDEALTASLHATMDEGFKEEMNMSNVNVHGASLWLLTTKWHLHVVDYDPLELKALVKPLAQGEIL
jgi:hypothetical protein